jgi:hypothetical protein
VIVVAILMLIVRGSAEAGPALVFSAIALAVGAWVWRRDSRAALIVSLVLGALWLLQFAAYTIADLVGDDFSLAIFVVDLVAVAAGIAVVVGAIRALLGRGRSAAAAADA